MCVRVCLCAFPHGPTRRVVLKLCNFIVVVVVVGWPSDSTGGGHIELIGDDSS